jgi:hypothetical protein
MRGVMLFQPDRLLLSSLALLAGLAGLTTSHQVRADERDTLIARIAATGPLPCDQQAVDLMNLQMERMEPDLVLAGMGKSMTLGDTWVAGNSFYDQARAVLSKAFEEEQAKNGQYFTITPAALIGKGLSAMSVEDLQYLAQFFDKPEGKLYWEETLDGSTCNSWLKKFAQAPYPALDAAMAERWGKTTAGLKGGQDRFVKRFNTLPKNTQAAYYDGKDKISSTVQQAPAKLFNERNQELNPRLSAVVQAQMAQLKPVIDAFKAARDGQSADKASADLSPSK